ncbi:Golgi mannosyltransferase complex subunit [Trapelia coarctata]|nr:Golgi mannosyltransferase complex subunit [Trapelia coarctata]
MAMARSLRRANPVTLVLAALLAIGFIVFVFSPTHATPISPPKVKHNSPASNPLSPPTAAYRKEPTKSHGRRVPPPVVHYQLNNLTTSPDPANNQETILILTPLARFYPEFWANLLSLSYPHHLIALGFITPRNREGNAATLALQNAIASTQSGPVDKRFASITILRQDFDPPLISQDEAERHKMSNQRERRAAMSRARNSLLFTTMGPSTAWVLWLDADIIETPPTLIQDLASHDKPVIVPNCFQRYTDENGKKAIRPYDFNSWVDSETAQELAKKMGPDDILLEGYAELATYRTLMANVAETGRGRDQSKIMSLDGVGGTALMVKAEVHRDGAMFPPFAFYHLMETEGFAKMARRLGWKCFGLPNYFVSLIYNLQWPSSRHG